MTASPHRRERPAVALAMTLLMAVLVASGYLRFVVPWEDAWGASAEDMARPLPGDEFVPNPFHELHHVVTVNAPPEKVWPWLIQLGQDRAGFYSYHWLENVFMAGIHNHDEIRPEWQARAIGELVPAVQPNYLGLVKGTPLGWEVMIAQPNLALGLEDWGTFALVPMDGGRTRFIARQRRSGPNPPLAWPPVTFVLNPAHFVMERRMLLHIKELAENKPVFPDWLRTLADVGWWIGAAAVALLFLMRRRPVSLLASLAAAGLVWWQTADLLGAQAAFMGLGLALVCLALGRWWAGLWTIALGVFTYAVLALAPDAWVVFGLVFGLAGVPLVAIGRPGTR